MDFSRKGKTSVTVKILGLDVVIDKHYITIKDSSKVKNKKSMESILKIARNMALKKGCHYKRTNKSWIQEWRAHNLLYKLHLFETHTKDTDLEECESKFRLFCYKILGR